MADLLLVNTDELENQEFVSTLISNKKSFQVVSIRDVGLVVKTIEDEIENQGMRVRVYTEYRSAALGLTLIPTGITQITGLATALGSAIHNACTFNPDYEIAKNQLKSRVSVYYKK